MGPPVESECREFVRTKVEVVVEGIDDQDNIKSTPRGTRGNSQDTAGIKLAALYE